MRPAKMKNRAATDLIEHRRRHVAALRVRGLTVREIVTALASREVNCRRADGRAWGLAVVHSDVVAIRQRWLDDAAEEISEHVARILAELREVKRAAWQSKNYRALLTALRQEAELTGANAPKKIAPVMPNGTDPYVIAAR